MISSNFLFRSNYKLIILLVIILSACSNNSIENEIEDFKSRKIDLKLGDLKLISGDTVSTDSKKYKLVVYTDSSECTPCQLFQMFLWDDFLKETNAIKDSIDVLFVFNFNEDIEDDIITDVGPYLHGARLLLDSLGSIKNCNEYFPKSKTLHTFLLNGDNDVVLVGDPIKNVAIEDLYKKAFVCLFKQE